MAILFKVNHAEPPSPWEQYFDNTYFKIYEDDPWGSWSTDRWLGEDIGGGEQYLLYIEPLGTWHENYRPTKMRFTCNNTSYDEFRITMRDNAQNVIVNTGGYNTKSGDEITITFNDTGEPDDDKMRQIEFATYLYPGFQFEITNIEFLP